jgi:hypothetical protein
MRRKHLWFIVVVGLGVALGYWWKHRSSSRVPAPPAVPAAPAATAAKPGDAVAIHDRQTIDFSSGKPVAKDTAADQAAIDAAVKEMNDATKNITFGPSIDPKKTPEPAPSK